MCNDLWTMDVDESNDNALLTENAVPSENSLPIENGVPIENDLPIANALSLENLSNRNTVAPSNQRLRSFAERERVRTDFQRLFASRDFSVMPMPQFVMRMQRFHFRRVDVMVLDGFEQWLARQRLYTWSDLSNVCNHCDLPVEPWTLGSHLMFRTLLVQDGANVLHFFKTHSMRTFNLYIMLGAETFHICVFGSTNLL